MYLGIILIWFGLGVALQNPFRLPAWAAYVVPVMWFYIQAEERMMASEFGTPFEEYARRAGRLLPRLRRGAV